MPSSRKILPREFFKADTVAVAKKLLGKYLVRRINNELIIGRIVETEAYLPFGDPASHNYIGKTLRNEVLFGEAGFAYVHSIHKYHCIDIVTEGIAMPGSVLIRAVEPISGIDQMMKSRNLEAVSNLTNGPGKLCQAFQITRELNGIDVTLPDSEITIEDSNNLISDDQIIESVRIGISKAVDLLLRFSLKENKFVSK